MPENDLGLIKEAAEVAGEIALSYFKKNAKTWDKGDGAGPVTEADLAVNEHLARVLRKARPDYGWLSEETVDSDARLRTRRQFIVDPIDGTRAFIEGSRNWAISVAVVEDRRPIAGIVVMPAKEDVFAARLDGGATLNGESLRASEQNVIENTVLLTNKVTLKPHHWQAAAPPPVHQTFRSSLAYRLSAVAQGRFDAMMTLRPTWEWDIAAGIIIVQEAGGVAMTRRGEAMLFNNPTPQIDGVVAGSPIVHELVSLLA